MVFQSSITELNKDSTEEMIQIIEKLCGEILIPMLNYINLLQQLIVAEPQLNITNMNKYLFVNFIII